MRALAVGAVLGLVWVVLGLPLATPVTVPSVLAEPVTIAFVLGLVARPFLARSGRWAR